MKFGTVRAARLLLVVFAGVICACSGDSKPTPANELTVSVFGAVKHPGAFTIPSNGLSLQQLLAAAGGGTSESGDARITLIRQVAGKEQTSTYSFRVIFTTGAAPVPIQVHDVVSVAAE